VTHPPTIDPISAGLADAEAAMRLGGPAAADAPFAHPKK